MPSTCSDFGLVRAACRAALDLINPKLTGCDAFAYGGTSGESLDSTLVSAAFPGLLQLDFDVADLDIRWDDARKREGGEKEADGEGGRGDNAVCVGAPAEQRRVCERAHCPQCGEGAEGRL